MGGGGRFVHPVVLEPAQVSEITVGIGIAVQPCMALLLIPLLSFSLASDADPSAHRFRLHGDASLFDGRFTSYAGSSVRTRVWQFARPSLGLGVGGRIVPWLWIGARVTANGGRQYSRGLGLGTGVHRYGAFEVGVDPYVEVRPLPARKVQPFVMGHAGFTYQESRARDVAAVRYRGLVPRGGVRVGMHWFVLPRLSVDADVGVEHAWRYVRGQDTYAHASNTVSLSGRLGVSGWW